MPRSMYPLTAQVALACRTYNILQFISETLSCSMQQTRTPGVWAMNCGHVARLIRSALVNHIIVYPAAIPGTTFIELDNNAAKNLHNTKLDDWSSHKVHTWVRAYKCDRSVTDHGTSLYLVAP